jgi:hypothetical protein
MKVLILAVLLLAAAATSPRAATLKGTLKYSRSGGFAGVSERASFAAEREGDLHGQEAPDGDADARERSRLARYAEAADIPTSRSRRAARSVTPSPTT